MEPHNSNNNNASPPPPPPPPPPRPAPHWTTSTSQAELPAPPPMPPQSPPLPAPHHWPLMTTSPPMSQAEMPPQYSQPYWPSESQEYYYQPMVMPPPLHYQPAPPGMYDPPPGQYNVDPGMLAPYVPAYEYNYPGYQRTWSTDLCDCRSDCHNCLMTGCCPCVTFGQVSEIVNQGQTSCWEGCFMYGLLSVILGLSTGGICTGIFGGFYRYKLREKYKLRGTVFNDFLVHALCEPCALCQEYRELGRFGFEVPLGWKRNMEMQKAATAVYQVAPVIEQGMMR